MSFGELDWVPEVPYPDSGNKFKVTQLFNFQANSMQSNSMQSKTEEKPRSFEPVKPKRIRRRRKRKSSVLE